MYILLCSKSFKLGFPRNWFCSSLTINCIIITVEAIQWLDWGNWTHCTRTCGPGVKFRARSCSKPDLAGTSGCLGNSTEIKPCLEAECPGVFFCKCLLPCYFDQSTCYWLPLPGLVTHSLTHSLGLIDWLWLMIVLTQKLLLCLLMLKLAVGKAFVMAERQLDNGILTLRVWWQIGLV